jgi:transcriptional regulator with XRE-family HTH domain
VAKRHDLQKRALIGANLASARRLAGYSQSDVMHIVWHETTNQKNRISEMESGKSLPDAELLSELCLLYGVSADYICGISAEPEIDQTAGRVGLIYNGLSEIAASSVQQMVEGLSRLSANYIAAMPKPHALALMEAAKLVWREYTKKEHDQIKQAHPLLGHAIFMMFKVVQEFDKAQAVNLTGYNMALDAVLERQSDDPRHHLGSDAIPRLKRYPCTSLPLANQKPRNKRGRKSIRQLPLSWARVSEVIDTECEG